MKARRCFYKGVDACGALTIQGDIKGTATNGGAPTQTQTSINAAVSAKQNAFLRWMD